MLVTSWIIYNDNQRFHAAATATDATLVTGA